MTHATQAPVLAFERHECKYLLTERQARAVYSWVAPYVEPDPYAARAADHSYAICSLYLDTPNYLLLNETNSGVAERYKLRIRSYSDDPDGAIFPEIKKRKGAVIYKLRSRIRRADLGSFLAYGDDGFPGSTTVEDGAREEFRALAHGIRAVPVVQVGYLRKAYMGRVDRGVRVTFDRDLRACVGDGGELSLPRSNWEIVESSRVVLELKFNDQAPAWVSETVRRLGLERTSYSKYANSIAACAARLRWTGLRRS